MMSCPWYTYEDPNHQALKLHVR